MNKLGLYFGSRVISIVEVKGRQVLNNIQISVPATPADASGIVLPEEAKIVALIKEELIRRKIEAKEAAVSLSGKDLLIRNFEIALLPTEELANAVNFEVRKYIPFKIEDLVSDFQHKVDKAAQKNRILFVAIKKETLERYLSIANGLELKVTSLEYSAFSILRLLKLGNTGSQKGIKGIFSIDLVENDEINFLVMEDGFPLFSRDVVLAGSGTAGTEGAKPEVAEPSVILEKLKREIRISLDYYDRTLPLKNIDKILFVMDRNYQDELEGFVAFVRDIGLTLQFIDLKRCLGRVMPFSLAFLKSYTTALSNINTGLKPDLLQARDRAVKKTVAAEQPQTKLGILLAQLKTEYAQAAMTGILICLAAYYFGVSRLAPLQKELNRVIAMRPAAISSIKSDTSYDELVNMNMDYKKKINTLDELLKKKIYITELLDIIPRITPRQIRLAELSLTRVDNRMSLVLRGMIYMGDSKQEMDAVNNFLTELKGNLVFAKHFKEISLVSINNEQMLGKAVTTFVISGKN